MNDDIDDGVSYSTEMPGWIEQEACRLRRERWISRAVVVCEIVLWVTALGVLLAVIF